MAQGPYKAEHWVLTAPEITGDPEEPAGVVHFDEDGYLTLVQCPHIHWGMLLNDILFHLNAKDTLYNEAPDITTNFFFFSNNLIERYDYMYPKILKRTLEKEYHIFVLKYDDTVAGTMARELLDDFQKSSHRKY